MQICKRGITEFENCTFRNVEGCAQIRPSVLHFWRQLCAFCLELAPFASTADLSLVSCPG
jgi:hypothetical protein